jgi:HEPN domain-containing protein
VPDDTEYAAHWWRLAIGDLAGATSIATDEELPPRLAASLAHQAAEKALKAAIALTGEEPARTHDLVALAARLTGPAAITVSPETLRDLSDAHVGLRYPDTLQPPITWPEVDDLIQRATAVIEQVRASLERQGLHLDSLRPA